VTAENPQPRRPSSHLLPALRRARDVADTRFAEPLTLDVMARAANLSRFHFVREFAAAYGETPRAYVTRRRIERANDLLRSANLTVTEVCLLVGFESHGSFRASQRRGDGGFSLADRRPERPARPQHPPRPAGAADVHRGRRAHAARSRRERPDGGWRDRDGRLSGDLFEVFKWAEPVDEDNGPFAYINGAP
jgi:AraC-like DNA-binding protein